MFGTAKLQHFSEILIDVKRFISLIYAYCNPDTAFDSFP